MTRESRKKDDLELLRAENRNLRKQLARHRKMAERVLVVPEEEAEALPPEPTGPQRACDECGSRNLKSISLPTGTKLQICVECKKRLKK